MKRRTALKLLAAIPAGLLAACSGILWGLWWWWNRDPLGAYRTLRGHKDVVHGLAFNDTGELLATAGSDGLRIWQISDGREIDSWPGTMLAVRWVQDRVIVASAELGILVINVRDKRTEQSFGQGAPFIAMDVSADGQRIAAAFSPYFGDFPSETRQEAWAIHVWDRSSGEEVSLLMGHRGPVLGIAFDTHGMTLISWGLDTTLRRFDIGESSELARSGETRPGSMRWFSGEHVAIDVNPVGSAGVVGNNVFPLDSLESQQLKGDPSILATVGGAFSPDGQLIATGHKDGMVRLWQPYSRELVGCFPASLNLAEIYGVAFSPDGTLLATGGKGEIGTFSAIHKKIPGLDRAVRVWRVADLPKNALRNP